jgi:hypothetical protein
MGRPVDFRARMQTVGVNCPVRCGGVLVSPGEAEAEAIKRANDKAERETTVLDELRAALGLGSLPRAVNGAWTTTT